MASLEHEQENSRDAGTWFLRAIDRFASANDARNAQRAAEDFARTLHEAPPDARDNLRQQWIDAGHSEDELDDLLDQVRADESD